ncbi:Zinc finger RING-CH-type [Penicillium paradoxum]|uniref:Zinc finger RING-CH-type n=1 Tax=Penicillium paradoxum TaxID=176176 RepID=UPI00254776F1|nr:Zinc finger RING-CH-type [Penicillium paradoxum]KAJ5788240.1 Zinc finger RING-CH-type [Penicillium paradoxum]
MEPADNRFRDIAGSAATPFPDLMNDPAYDEREKGFDDLDTCRICHGEATEEEPLFYPCKCSGSIKFVHQICLVEWLSHSQKKHCELCKTPFRFTKLYDPNMPQSLPAPLFLKQALIQCFRTLVTWLRFVLVAFVWLGWLPWSMRAIWRALFWLADGRWSASDNVRTQAAKNAQEGLGQLFANGSVANAGVANSVTSTISNAAISATAVPSAPSSMLDFATHEPLMLTLIKKVMPNLFMPAFTSTVGQGNVQNNSTITSTKPRYPSWLSDVKFLNSLTPYPTINNMIMDTLEGQLITLLVVVAFILLFLIREWVVQQQPMANIAEGEREAALQLIANANNRINDRFNEEGGFGQREAAPAQPGNELNNPRAEANELDNEILPRFAPHSPAPSSNGSDYDLPGYEAELRGLDENDPDYEPEGPPLTARAQAFRDLVARTHGNHEEMLRILREEAHGDDFDWIVNAITGATVNRDASAGPSSRPGDNDNPENLDGSDAVNSVDGGTNDILLDAHAGPSVQSPVNESQARDNASPIVDIQPEERPPQAIGERIIDWFWGDITPIERNAEEPVLADEEHIVQDPALEDPFVPLPNRMEDIQANANANAAAGRAGLDPNDVEAVEGDDFEGIMDLIGMQGPIFGLFQNGVFCALLIAFTVAIGIWLPYLWGKIALVLLANPLELVIGVPITAVEVVADIALDTLIGVVGYLMYWFSFVFKIILSPFSAFIPIAEWIPRDKSVTSASLSLIDASSHRLNKVIKAFLVFHESDIPMFSVLSHQALKLHQARLNVVFHWVFVTFKFILHDFPLRIVTLGVPGALSFDLDFSQAKILTSQIQQQLTNIAKSSVFSMPGTRFMNASAAKAASATVPVDYELAVWDSKDRVIAIFMGYLLASMIGLLYLRITGLLSGANRGQRIEGMLAEVLIQAGGVMKVILIIGIEMIVFPLYCGSLLDLALLPLFSEATVTSRIAFTAASPLTSLFVHWFVGTCYMFHFALFVSMCRKILRSGVLYFIRDPDDPTFHPIRDVLERTITTQLRKIGFSALVYGALVIVCLGGVVWGLHFALDGVLPIHWSASAPMLEFPVDLLFYNFVLPVIIQSFKPSDGFHDIYNWWFHKCAHFLRLSNFFFPERHPEEEGYHVRKTWWAVLSRSKGDWQHPVVGNDQLAAAERENREVYFLRDGRYVRAPGSDQVRIPKGTNVFLEVTENNDRIDMKHDPADGLHGRSSSMFTKVYVPPSFRTRIAAFILLIWLFAATTGVGITIIPLIIGRKIIMSYSSTQAPVNDVYAFSSGLCVVGAFAYLAYYSGTALDFVREHSGGYIRSPRQAAQTSLDLMLHAARLLYVFIVAVIVLPSLFALLTELYVLIPAHTIIGDGESHVVHVVQDWALGVLYVQMAVKLTFWQPHSWVAAAVNSVFHDGWLKPNVSIATRALVLPIILFASVAIALPLSFGFIVRWTMFYSHVEVQPNIYRYAYPTTLLIVLFAFTVHLLIKRVAVWRTNIRDEVYLIGERLHNFSEKRARDVGVSRMMTG